MDLLQRIHRVSRVGERGINKGGMGINGEFCAPKGAVKQITQDKRVRIEKGRLYKSEKRRKFLRFNKI